MRLYRPPRGCRTNEKKNTVVYISSDENGVEMQQGKHKGISSGKLNG
jgi:hypothetical protein